MKGTLEFCPLPKLHFGKCFRARTEFIFDIFFFHFSTSVCSAFLIYSKSNHLSPQQLPHKSRHYLVQCSWPPNEFYSFHSCFPLSLSFIDPLMVLSKARIKSSHSLAHNLGLEARSLLSELNTFTLHPNIFYRKSW